MEQLEATAEKVGWLLKAKMEQHGEKVVLQRQRTLEILAENNYITCTLSLQISFEHLKEDGSAFNKAEIFLLPEEVAAFVRTLSEHRFPFPTRYRQWQNATPQMTHVFLESFEPPEHFAERLAAALATIES